MSDVIENFITVHITNSETLHTCTRHFRQIYSVIRRLEISTDFLSRSLIFLALYSENSSNMLRVKVAINGNNLN